ncbi:MAG: helix-turn-helix transcriptional regulator [Proteobacteria bacterium]|nr:helix-turn-helix transcriptional regulator [Pseudomonadota bacterium]
MPELFQSLRRLVGFSQGIFVDVGPDLFPGYYYGHWDIPYQTSIGNILYGEFLTTGRLAEVLRSRAEILALPPIAHLEKLLLLSGDEYRRHDIYQRVARPAQVFHALYMKLAGLRDGRLGLMLMNRPAGDQDFCSEEVRRLRDMIPFLSAAMGGYQSAPETWVDSCDQAIVVLDAGGKVQYYTDQGATLIPYALDRRQRPMRRWKPFRTELVARDILNTLVRRLRCLGGSGAEMRMPSLQRRNGWGRFEFRARWLEPLESGETSLIAVTVIRQVPLRLKLASDLRRFPLSAREFSVCLEIALGGSYKDIGKKLHLSEHTVVAHSRAIYEKLGINGRSELLTQLYMH